MNEAILDGCNFKNAALTGCDLSNCKARYAIFLNTEISDANFSGANLTGATLPINANTKTTFKSIVGAGHWDPDTTIWTDGLPIGN